MPSHSFAFGGPVFCDVRRSWGQTVGIVGCGGALLTAARDSVERPSRSFGKRRTGGETATIQGCGTRRSQRKTGCDSAMRRDSGRSIVRNHPVIAVLMWLSMWFVSGVGAQPAGNEYRLGPGDVVRITVYNNPDLTTEAQVTQQGRITFPLIGEVQIGGIEKGQAEQIIARRLAEGGFVVKPQVNVLVLGFKSQQISVLGQVNRPGKYPIEQASTLADLLAIAGGVAPNGADVVTHITHGPDGKATKREIDINDALRNGNMEKNFPVMNGDIIFVPRAPLFYIYGEVQRPGAYRLEKDMTVMQALSVGGGLNPRGTQRGIRINRNPENGKLVTIEGKMADMVLENDVIFVRESLF